MKILAAVVVLFAALGAEKLIRFFMAGGSLTQPARNATFMYRQIRRVYDRMPDNHARFMALYLNSAVARSQISEDLLRSLVKETAGLPWAELCESYTWLWAELVGHINVSALDPRIRASRNAKIRDQIEWAEFSVEHGDRKYENQLRSMSQAMVMMIVAKADHPFA